MDFFEHEMGEPTLFGRHGIPTHLNRLFGNFLVSQIKESHTVSTHDGAFSILQIHDVSGVLQNGGHIGGDEILFLAKADD